MQLPLTAGPASQGETVQVRVWQEDPSPGLLDLDPFRKCKCTLLPSTLGTKPCREVPFFISSCIAYMEKGEQVHQQPLRLWSKSTLAPKETKWKNSPRMESVLCAETLPVICKLKALWRSVMALPHPEATINPDTQDKRILSCPL